MAPNPQQPCLGPCTELAELRMTVQFQSDRLAQGERRFNSLEGKLDKVVMLLQRVSWTLVGGVIVLLLTQIGVVETLKLILFG